MAEQVENDNPTTDEPTEDTPTEDTPADDTPTEDTPDEPNYAALIEDLTARVNDQADQIETLTQIVADLREENADLVENITDEPEVTDSHNTGDEFLDELFS